MNQVPTFSPYVYIPSDHHKIFETVSVTNFFLKVCDTLTIFTILLYVVFPNKINVIISY